MSLYVALNTAVSGLFANQRAIAATSENIANVNTPNFARREAHFYSDAIPNQFSGVDVDIARAAVDRFLQTATYGGNADEAASTAIADALSRVEASLGAPGDNISYANKLDEAFASLTQLSANPSSTAAKADALSALQAAFDAFARTRAAIGDESASSLGRLNEGVARVNALLGEIYHLNQVVQDSNGAADLIDQRLSELSRYLSIDVTRSEDGRVEVSTAGGAALVDSAGYSALGVSAGPPTAISLSSVDPETGASAQSAADIAALIGPGGEIGGLITLRNTELPQLQALVETTARAVAAQLNNVYAGNVATGATAPGGGGLIHEANGVFFVDPALIADPSGFAIARPAGGASAGANDGSGAVLLAGVATSLEARAVVDSIASIGSAARNAELSATSNKAIAADLNARASADSGVNLDEELSNLILYQRAYGANARVISAVDELWRSLLQII
ncbi:MAG: flagellar hook-associated protein FlgK [Parvularculaceae bacterium]|nr:flagellar hook-associated protein FlgK [Parvularculaceae bacterium]